MVDDDLREEIVSELRCDWLDFDQIAFLVRDTSGDDSNLMSRALDVIEELILLGIITPGAVRRHGFEPWTGTRLELIQRIRTESQQFPTIDSIPIGGICWFDLTEDIPKPAP